jgi:hypothetical protein
VTLRVLGIVDYTEGDTDGTTLTVSRLGHQVIAECASEKLTSPIHEKAHITKPNRDEEIVPTSSNGV